MTAVTSSFKWYKSGAIAVKQTPGMLLANDIKVILLTSAYTPNAATHQYYDVSITNELPTASGYTLGGLALTAKTFAADGSGFVIFDSNDPVWTVPSGTLTARTWAMYDNTPASNKPLLCYGSLNYNGGTPIDISTTISESIVLGADGWFKIIHTDNP